jgi:pimeloyl-ACP methyl ester carboxylesterase
MLQKSSSFYFVIHIVVLALCTIGCSNLAESLTGRSHSEQLREWARKDGKPNLLVFVPGFNSSKDEAWGSFIPLIKKDKSFNEYDIYSYGYPQQLCGQKNDIRDVGAHLKSILMEELPRYNTTIFVAHSMGGLVVLNALLELESSNFKLVSNKRLLVMSLGTPYYGAKMAGLFGALCPNPQGEAMQVLKKEGARLLQDWQQRFNKPEAEADRRTAKIPVHPFYGLNDELVEQASACGIGPGICESLDGDHASIAKPLNREHLTYKKLQSMKDKAGIKTIPPSNSIAELRMLDDAATLAKTCDQSRATLKRRPETFVAAWLSALNSLRHDRNIHDLQNLFEVWGRIPVGLTGKDLIEEATFTIKCLESSGQVKIEMLYSSGLYWGVTFENQRIVFENR